MQLADFAFGQGDDLHPREAQPLIERGNICLIAAQSVERLSQNGLEPARRGAFDETLEAWAKHRRSGNRSIGEYLDDTPPFAVCSFPAHPDLILDRGIALHLGRKSGIDCNLGHRIPLFIRLTTAA